jgi:SIR2-like domain
MPQDQDGPVRLPLKLRAQLETLAGDLLKGECLIFLGAGASVDRASAEDLPTGEELSKALAAKCEMEWHRYVPLSTTAFYYESFFTRKNLNAFLKEQIEKPGIEPSRTIRTLIEIVEILEQRAQPVFVITTNYDRHFETAYRERLNRDPHVIVYRGAEDPNLLNVQLHEGLDVDPQYWHPAWPGAYLYKMHGCISRADPRADEHSLVVTEEDYINFLANALSEDPKKWLAHEVRGRIALSTVLFIGYSLSDWNFRVIFKATAERSHHRTSYAVQYFSPPSDPLAREREEERWQTSVEFWSRKNVAVINADAAAFMGHLLSAVRAAAGVGALV